MKLKKYLLATALVGLGSAPTLAADLAARPYTKAPALAAVYDWTGFYLGVNAGVGLGRNRVQHDLFRIRSRLIRFYTSPQGGFGGGQIGYNWQTGSVLGPIVFGVEADIQGGGLSDDRTNFTCCRPHHDLWPEARLVRHRARAHRYRQWSGAELCDRRLRVRKRQDQRDRIGARAINSTFATDRTQSGWVVGSGVEAALGGNWTGKIEYLYLNLGNKTDAHDALVATPINTEIRENIFRVGLNYRIGGNSAYAPVAAANWAGFYLGGNFGSGTGRDRSSLSVPAAAILETFNLAPDGINGGVQAGYNWQAANWVFGLEADIQGSTQKDNKTCILELHARAHGGLRCHVAVVRHGARAAGLFGRVDLVLRHRRSRLWQHQDQDQHELLRSARSRNRSRTPIPAGPQARASKRRLRCSDCWARTGRPRPNISMSTLARRRTTSFSALPRRPRPVR